MQKQITTAIVIFVILFSIELTAYIQEFVSRTISGIALYAIAIVCMLMYVRRANNSLHIPIFYWTALSLYLVLLFIRIYIDFIIPEVGFFLYSSPWTILFFFCCSILFPSIFFYKYEFKIDIKKGTFIIACLLLCCVLKSLFDIFSGNAIQNNDGRFETAIFSIGFGQYSTSLCLIGIYLFLESEKLTLKTLFLAFAAIGFIGTIVSGSRGPFVALSACTSIMIVSRLKRPMIVILVALLLYLCSGFIIDFIIQINDILNQNDIHSFDRVIQSLFVDDSVTEHTSGRDNLYKEAINLAWQKPIIGYSYLIPGKIYVHNIIIEQFMATGLFGGMAFVYCNLITIIWAFRLMRYDRRFSIVPILFIQYLIYGCLSITILSIYPYWLFMLITINKYENLRKSKQHNELSFSNRSHPYIQE